MKAKIYAEGGGEGEYADTHFRQAWSQFFDKAGLRGKKPAVVRGKGRHRTFDLFATAVRNRKPDELPILLLDSETTVKDGHSAWEHLEATDAFRRPDGVAHNQAFLMVQVMETWFLADLMSVESFFGAGFRVNVIPTWPALEAVDKSAVLRALADATSRCSPKRYEKGRISFDLLARIHPPHVEARCPSAKALLDHLRSL